MTPRSPEGPKTAADPAEFTDLAAMGFGGRGQRLEAHMDPTSGREDSGRGREHHSGVPAPPVKMTKTRRDGTASESNMFHLNIGHDFNPETIEQMLG